MGRAAKLKAQRREKRLQDLVTGLTEEMGEVSGASHGPHRDPESVRYVSFESLLRTSRAVKVHHRRIVEGARLVDAYWVAVHRAGEQHLDGKSKIFYARFGDREGATLAAGSLLRVIRECVADRTIRTDHNYNEVVEAWAQRVKETIAGENVDLTAEAEEKVRTMDRGDGLISADASHGPITVREAVTYKGFLQSVVDRIRGRRAGEETPE